VDVPVASRAAEAQSFLCLAHWTVDPSAGSRRAAFPWAAKAFYDCIPSNAGFLQAFYEIQVFGQHLFMSWVDRVQTASRPRTKARACVVKLRCSVQRQVREFDTGFALRLFVHASVVLAPLFGHAIYPSFIELFSGCLRRSLMQLPSLLAMSACKE
jgi:hypothetical protein